MPLGIAVLGAVGGAAHIEVDLPAEVEVFAARGEKDQAGRGPGARRIGLRHRGRGFHRAGSAFQLGVISYRRAGQMPVAPHAALHHLRAYIQPHIVPESDEGFGNLHILGVAAGPGPELNLVVRVIVGFRQQFHRPIRIVGIDGRGIFLVHPQGAGDAVGAAGAAGFGAKESQGQGFAVDGVGQGLADFQLPQFRMPDGIHIDGINLAGHHLDRLAVLAVVDGFGLVNGHGPGQVGLAGLNHRRAHNFLFAPDVAGVFDGGRLGDEVHRLGFHIAVKGGQGDVFAAHPFIPLVGTPADNLAGGVPLLLGYTLVVAGSDENVELAESRQHRAGAFADEIHGVVVDDFGPGFPHLGIGLIFHIAAQLIDGVGGGFGVPSLAVVERDALPQGQPPGVGFHLVKAGKAGGSGVGEVRPKEGDGLNHIVDNLVGVQSSADPGVGNRRFLVDDDGNVVPAGDHGGGGRPGRGLHRGNGGMGGFRGRGRAAAGIHRSRRGRGRDYGGNGRRGRHSRGFHRRSRGGRRGGHRFGGRSGGRRGGTAAGNHQD